MAVQQRIDRISSESKPFSVNGVHYFEKLFSQIARTAQFHGSENYFRNILKINRIKLVGWKLERAAL